MTTKLEQAARQAQIAISDAVNALLFLARDCEMRNSAVEIGDKAITTLREALKQPNCQCGDKCFPVFSGDIEYCETCGKPTALAEQAKQEPVAVVAFDTQSWRNLVDALTKLPDGTKLYAEPANKTEEKPLLVQAWEKRFAEQAEQEPVAIDGLARACNLAGIDYKDFLRIKAYLPIAAPVRTKDLTDDEIEAIHGCPPAEWVRRFARAVIAADREKNK